VIEESTAAEGSGDEPDVAAADDEDGAHGEIEVVGTREASSTRSMRTPEKPRLVVSTPGRPTIRELLGKRSEISLSPSPRGLTPRRDKKPPALRTSSADWRRWG